MIYPPLNIFEAQPVTSKRIVTVTVQPESADSVSILMSGNVWVYRARFDAHGVPGSTNYPFSLPISNAVAIVRRFIKLHAVGQQLQSPGAHSTDEKKTYYRTLKSIDTSNDEHVKKVLSMFGEDVLKGLAVRVVLDTDPDDNTSAHALVEQLRKLPQCHFV